MSGTEGWSTEPLHLRPVGPSVDYATTARGPVQFVAVGRPGAPRPEVLGYLWASDAEDAADWVSRPAAGDDGENAGVAWYRRLRAARARGRTPSQALADLAGDPGGPRIGRVLTAQPGQSPDLAELRALAAADAGERRAGA